MKKDGECLVNVTFAELREKLRIACDRIRDIESLVIAFKVVTAGGVSQCYLTCVTQCLLKFDEHPSPTHELIRSISQWD